MIAEAIEKIHGLAKPMSLEVDDMLFINKAAQRVVAPTVAAIKISSLSGLVDILKSNRDGLEGVLPFSDNMANVFIHVLGHNDVQLVSMSLNRDLVRDVYAIARYEAKGFEFGRFMPVEDFNIALQTLFVQTDVVGEILKITGNIVYESGVKTRDDGRTQTVTAKSGIVRVEEVILPSQVTLTPYRTFLELEEQPSGLFVLRIKQQGDVATAALFEADSGLWKIEAVRLIKTWLTERLSTFKADDRLVIVG